MFKFSGALLILLSAAEVVSSTPPRSSIFNWAEMRYVYAFGDSYSFVQGTGGLANYSFIGDAFNISFTPQELLTNEIIPRNTSSDGSNWLEFLTGCFSGLPSNCSPHQLWDFSFAGADISAALLPLHHDFSVDLVDQVNQWAKYAADIIPHPAKQTLTAWWIGINDTGDTLKNATITDTHAFWEIEMTYYFGAVEHAYQTGLGGTYLFINVPPEERSPAWINDPSDASTLKQHIDDFNGVLADYVQTFASEHQQLHVLTFDAHAWFNNILENAAAYGFKNITGYCECTDDTYFWYNTGHPTQRVHLLLAQAIQQQLEIASIRQ